MRLAIPTILAVMAFGLVSCSNDGKRAELPVPVSQRFLTVEDAPGSQPDPVELRQTTEKFDEFIAVLKDASIDPDMKVMSSVFHDASFKSAGVDARFFGATHNSDTSPHVFSSFIELGSKRGATSALEWLEADTNKPCPFSCATQITAFDVAHIPGVRGVHRVATAENIAAVGATEQRPQERFWVGFIEGAIVYTMDLQGPPGSVSEQQAQDIANAWYDRLTRR